MSENKHKVSKTTKSVKINEVDFDVPVSDTNKKRGSKTFSDYYKDPKFKERFLRRQKERIECECGSFHQRSGIAKHRKTELHKRKYELKQKNEELKQKYELQQKNEELKQKYELQKISAQKDSNLADKLNLIIKLLEKN
jgi:hypothetical protein